jgi:hypothetical protein
MTEQNMTRLREALTIKQRVEIHLHSSFPSASPKDEVESARSAAEANARDERVARIIGAERERKFECGVNAGQVLELLKLGAVEV